MFVHPADRGFSEEKWWEVCLSVCHQLLAASPSLCSQVQDCLYWMMFLFNPHEIILIILYCNLNSKSTGTVLKIVINVRFFITSNKLFHLTTYAIAK